MTPSQAKVSAQGGVRLNTKLQMITVTIPGHGKLSR